MITRCSEKNRKDILDYVYQDSIMNLFIIGDIETFGFDDQNQTVFIDKELNEIKTVYLVYRTNLVIGSLSKTVDQAFVEKLIVEYDLTDINGDLEIISQLNLEDFNLEVCKIASLSEMNPVANNQAQLLEENDIPKFVEATKLVFDREIDLEKTIGDFRAGTEHFYGCKVDGKLVSGARSSAESQKAAMIIGVYTLEEYRRNGYGFATVARLCQDFIDQNKSVCLFFSNPDAAKMYHKLGFVDYGDYGLMRRK